MININWKALFWISLMILFISNAIWLFKLFDHSRSVHYYEQSCERYSEDVDQLKKLLISLETKDQVVEFLTTHDLDFEEFDKIEEYAIQLNSFSISLDPSGSYKEVQ